MYAGVPTTAPAAVSGVSSKSGDSPGLGGAAGSSAAPSTARASPKSVTRARPSSSMRTLSSLKSRCTIPAACAAASPRPAPRNSSSTACHDRGSRASQRRTVSPGTSSIARNTPPSYVPTSWIATTFGCASRAIACASRSSRDCDAESPPGRTSLIATLRASSGSIAA